ncbi:MAG TPA: ABC transporter substrate-binding protein [Actinomycetota bacterium]|nr:ABC transporter substrate-binding protein [Actinomycetota bacterium]
MTGSGDAVDPPAGGGRNDAAAIRTFLIADVRGWTLFTQERGDEAAAKLAAKFADTVREVVETRGGTLLELRGDEAMCVFSSSREAIRSAVELQVRFAEETVAQPDLPLTVGIGLDAGEAVPVEGGYRGGALNLAARLCGQARAGEVLASREVTHLARRLDGVRYEDRGSMSFKNLPDPVEVVRVVPEGEDPIDRLRPFTPTPPAPPERRSRRWVIAVATVVTLALLAVAISLLGSDDPGAVDLGTNSIARMDAGNGGLELATDLGQRPGVSVIGFGSLWVVQPDRGVVTRLDLEDGSVSDTIRVGAAPAGITVGDGSVWVTNSGDGTVSRVNVETNEATQLLDAGTGPTGIAFGDGALWVADTLGAELLRIDPVTGETRAVAVAGQPSSVAFSPVGVWVAFAPAGISRVDPADASVAFTKPVGNGPTAVLSAFGSIWVANHLDGTVTRLDPATGAVQATIAADEGPSALAAAGDSVWVANEFADSITAIDVEADTVRQTIPVGAAASSLASEGDSLWLAVGASAAAHRGGTLTVMTTDGRPRSLDPASAFNDSIEGQILSLTNDGLLTFKKVPGADGSTLVPDLAAALPEVSPDGLAYRFVLREGVRYSTGDPVRPEDFRTALERSVAVDPDVAPFLFSALEGMDTCVANPSACDLSRAVEVDDGSVTFHLQTPDPDLPFKLAQPPAYPLPPTVPNEDQDLKAMPATGPYMLDEASRGGITMTRNPEFDEWSAAAQPDGFVDQISWRFGQDAEDAFDAVVTDESDVLTGDVRDEDLASLEAAHPDRIVRWPTPFAAYIGFDMRVPPFDDPRVRQALNYALDRKTTLGLAGGPNEQRVACQIFPPNLQGYEPFCPYTIGPDSGVWSAPDVDRARALMEEAGALGAEPTVWVTDFGPFLQGSIEVMRYVTRLLEDLGMRPHLKVVGDNEEYFSGVFEGEPHLYLGGWGGTYTGGGGGWIDENFRCSFAGSAPTLCTDELERAIDEAKQLQATDPAAANDAWTQIEHGLVEDAVWVPLTNSVSTVVVSDRTGNVQVHPQWGILLSRVWVE